MKSIVIADTAQRLRALDPSTSFIVQAPAGSGKTELLTQRTLALLAVADEPEEVVAITFTRKAAAEMRTRVFAAIRSATGAAPTDAHARQTWELAGRTVARSRVRNWDLEQSPQRLRITTIDALALIIAQQSPLLSKLGGGVIVEDDPQELYRQAARETLTLLEDPQYGAPIAQALQHYDNRVQALEKEIADLLPRRDQWLALATDAAPEHRREAMEAVLLDCAASTLRTLEALLPAQIAQKWHALARYAADNLARAGTTHQLLACRDLGAPDYGAESLAQWQALIALVFTGDSGWRATFNKRFGFPPGETARGKIEAKEFKHRAAALVEGLRRIDGMDALLMRIRALPPVHYADAQWQVMVALLDTLKLAAQQLNVLFAAGGTVDFVEINLRAIDALGQHDAPTDLALRMDYRLRHLLVDEFQDTSKLQLALLQSLTAGWQSGDGRTLFVVGDPMQSIYRFRDAEVGLFLDARRGELCGIALEPLALSCNFRSSAGLVDWFNATFPSVLAPAEDARRGAVAYAAAVAARDGSGGMQLRATIGSDWNGEARAVVETIAQIRKREPAASIAVLVRYRSHLRAIAPALREAGLRYQAVEIEELTTRPVIDDLRALTRALLHPSDRVAWLAVLRAPWCGLTLADLQQVAEGLRRGAALLPALHESARIAAMSADGRARLRVTLDVLEAARQRQGRERLRDFVEQTWLALGGPACCEQTVDLADAARYFSVLDKLGRGGDLPSLGALDRALAQLRAAPDPDGGALQVMTIHKSKGLEFDHVLLPALHRPPRRADKSPLAWTTLPLADEAVGFLMAPVAAADADDDRAYEFVRDLEQERHAWEDSRLLYVAATRARRGLYLFGSCADAGDGPAPPARGSLLEKLWGALAPDFRDARAVRVAPESQAEELPARMPPSLHRFAAGWTPPAPRRELALPANQDIVFDWAGQTARAVGTIAHRWIQHIAENGSAEWPASRIEALLPAIGRALIAEGAVGDELIRARERVQMALRNMLDDERGRWILSADHADARAELRLHDSAGGQWIIDRSFIDDTGTRWIIDYKISAHEGGDPGTFLDREQERYRAQLENYARLFALIEERPVRLGLYFPLQKAWRSWDATN